MVHLDPCWSYSAQYIGYNRNSLPTLYTGLKSLIVSWSYLSEAASSQCWFFFLCFLLVMACQLHLKNRVTMFLSGMTFL